MANSPAPVPNYVPLATVKAQANGNWSNAATVFGRALQDNDVIDLAGKSLIYDLTDCPNLLHIFDSVGGASLDFGSAGGDKVLNFATLLQNGGSFACGSCINNVPLNGTMTFNFLDVPCDPIIDPGQFGTGWLTMATMVDLCGSANKTGWVWAQSASKGATTLTLNSTPNDWNVGDLLLIPDCVGSQDEVIAIGEISGTTVTLATPLQIDHPPMLTPQGQPIYLPVGNLTRRIVFQSANPAGMRGHVMFMKGMGGMPSVANACHALIKDCGRTLATIPVTDPMVDANGVLVPGTADNPRARYSWHSHRQGQTGPDGTTASCLQTWDSLVVWESTKLGFDNHDSNVNCTNSISFNCQGSCFFTERGSEIGTFTGCLAVRTSGVPGQAGFGFELSRLADEDLGWQGDGFWLTGPGVTLSGNVAIGHPDAGFHAFSMGPRPPAPTDGSGILAATFARGLLPANYVLRDPTTDPAIISVPFFGLSNNVAINCSVGHFIDWTQSDIQNAFTTTIQSPVNAPVSWNCPTGMIVTHAEQVAVTAPVLNGPACAVGSIGVETSPDYSSYITVNQPQIAEFETGIQMCSYMVVADGYYSNVWDFTDNLRFTASLITFQLTGNPSFVPVDSALLAGRAPLNFTVSPYLRLFYGVPNDQNPNDWFNPISYYLPNGLELFKIEQAADYVPMPSDDPNLQYDPPDLVGLTNQQLMSSYNVAVCGKMAGIPVTPPPYTTNGIISTAQPDKPFYVFGGGAPTSAFTTTTAAYQFSAYDYYDNIGYTDPAPITLQPGWNALTRTINGQNYTFWVELTGSSPPPPPPPPPSPVTTTVTATLTTASAIPAGTYSFTFTADTQSGSGTFTVS